MPTSPTRPEQGSPGTRGPIPPTLLTKPFSLTTCLDSLSLNLRCNVIARRRKEGLNVKKEKITFFPKQSLVSAPCPSPQTGLRPLLSAESLHYPDHPLSPCPQSGHFHVGRRQSKPLGARHANTHSGRRGIFHLWCDSPLASFGATGNVTEIQQELYFTIVRIKQKFQLYNTTEKQYHS